MSRKYIELFAGCGGMSLGLHNSGFKLYFANEISPMAAETYSYNLLSENLEQLSSLRKVAEKTLWIRSKYESYNLNERLKENPFEDVLNKRNGDLKNVNNLKDKLLIGDINDLITFLKYNPKILNKIRNDNIDLIAGGPPCQSFSLAGKRIKDDYKNFLPLAFAEIVSLTKPKTILLENVKGITAPFTENGIKYHAWLEIAKAFALKKYLPICVLLNSKFYKIPQGRTRFFLLGLREDIFLKILKAKNNRDDLLILQNSYNFYKKVMKSKDINEITVNDLLLHDYQQINQNIKTIFFPPHVIEKDFITTKESIHDIENFDYTPNQHSTEYVKYLNEKLKLPFNRKVILPLNHEQRKHTNIVKARFRLYQVLSKVNGYESELPKIVISKERKELHKLFEVIKGEELAFPLGDEIHFSKAGSFEAFYQLLNSCITKKHSQRALKEDLVAPSQLTIPDDYCHYSPSQLRTLTVREVARFQSFPDWFVFRSKVTTGGKLRRFEVPQYTQVGNAVPPLLAYEWGKTINQILNRIK